MTRGRVVVNVALAVVLLVSLLVVLCFTTGLLGTFGRRVRFGASRALGLPAGARSERLPRRATRCVRDALARTFFLDQINSVVDCGCGDHAWMSGFLRGDRVSRVAYLGVDLFGAPELTQRYSRSEKGEGASEERRFVSGDFVSDQLPRVDLVVARDVLPYLTNGEIKKALANMRRAGIALLLADRAKGARNWPLLMHRRDVDLGAPPFSLDLVRAFDGDDASYGLYRLGAAQNKPRRRKRRKRDPSRILPAAPRPSRK
jgi:hypothetical protein